MRKLPPEPRIHGKPACVRTTFACAARCRTNASGAGDAPDTGPLAQFIRPDLLPAAARAGGHALLLKIFAELPRIDMRVRDACGSCRMFAALCDSLSTLQDVPGSAGVTTAASIAQVGASIGQYLYDSCIATGGSAADAAAGAAGAASPQTEVQVRVAAEDLRAFAGLCASVGMPGRAAAAHAARHLCGAAPSTAAPLAGLLWQEVRRRCECAALAEGGHAFAEHWPAAVAAAAIVMGLPDGVSVGGAGCLRGFVREAAGKEESLANPAECAAVAAALAAWEVRSLSQTMQGGGGAGEPAVGGCAPGGLLPAAELQQLFGRACEMLVWVCDMAKVTEGHTRALVLATATAQALLVAVMAGGVLPAPGEPDARWLEGRVGLVVPEPVCRAAMKLCDGACPEPARIVSIWLLTAVRAASHLPPTRACLLRYNVGMMLSA